MAPSVISAVLDRRVDVRSRLVGLIPGEGVGPALGGIAHDVLVALGERSGNPFEIVWGGLIGADAVRAHGSSLTDATAAWFGGLFERGGAALCGPGGHRFVYDLRRRFDLYCKVSPIRVDDELLGAARLRPDLVRGLDLLVVRDNAAGIYQGSWRIGSDEDGARFAEHTFSYRERDVRRLVEAAARLAKGRRGAMCVVAKHGGVPTITQLWQSVTEEVARAHGLEARVIDADLAAYQLMHDPRAFDVVVCPNMIGDILGDLLAVALGSRGLSYSGNFATSGAAVYQTNHGSAWDLVDKDCANPVAHLYALAMMLEESYGLADDAADLRAAIRSVWRDGLKTADVAAPGDEVIGTRAFGARVVERLAGRA